VLISAEVLRKENKQVSLKATGKLDEKKLAAKDELCSRVVAPV